MSRELKASLSLTVYPEDAEHPTQWFPYVSRDAAVRFLDEAIIRAEGHLQHLQNMRKLVVTATLHTAAAPPKKGGTDAGG